MRKPLAHMLKTNVHVSVRLLVIRRDSSHGVPERAVAHAFFVLYGYSTGMDIIG